MGEVGVDDFLVGGGAVISLGNFDKSPPLGGDDRMVSRKRWGGTTNKMTVKKEESEVEKTSPKETDVFGLLWPKPPRGRRSTIS